MKKILYALNFLPWPPVSGGRKVSLATLQELGADNIIDLVCFDQDTSEEELAGLRKECPGLNQIHLVPYHRASRWKLPFMNLAGKCYFLFRDRSKAYQSKVKELMRTETYDLLFSDTLLVAANLIPLSEEIRHRVRWVSQLHNVNALLFKRFLNVKSWLWPVLFLEWLWLSRTERRYWLLPDRTVFISRTDRKMAETAVGPQSSFSDAFPGGLMTIDSPAIWDGGDGHTILHVGTGSWAPNVDGINWFLKRVWPKVSEQCPTAQFIHAGKDTVPSIHRWHNGESIDIHGFVPDLEPLFRRASVFVVPLRFGSGIKIKVLDALSRGIPVVTTMIGMEGIPIEPGEGVLVVDDPEALANHLHVLLKDLNYRLEMGRRARKSAEMLGCIHLTSLLVDEENDN